MNFQRFSGKVSLIFAIVLTSMRDIIYVNDIPIYNICNYRFCRLVQFSKKIGREGIYWALTFSTQRLNLAFASSKLCEFFLSAPSWFANKTRHPNSCPIFLVNVYWSGRPLHKIISARFDPWRSHTTAGGAIVPFQNLTTFSFMR